MPFMGDAHVDDHGNFRLIKGGAGNFSAMFNVQRLLGDRLTDVVDAMVPGGSGNPFGGRLDGVARRAPAQRGGLRTRPP